MKKKKKTQILEFDYQNQPKIMVHLQFLVKCNSSCDLSLKESEMLSSYPRIFDTIEILLHCDFELEVSLG